MKVAEKDAAGGHGSGHQGIQQTGETYSHSVKITLSTCAHTAYQ
jgi:hypothetical protein